AVVAARRRWRGVRPALPTGRGWLLAAGATGPASMIAMLAGWEVTEGGRQPWIVYGRMLVTDAVTHSPGLGWAFGGTLLLYLGLATALVLILRRMATGGPTYEATPENTSPTTSETTSEVAGAVTAGALPADIPAAGGLPAGGLPAGGLPADGPPAGSTPDGAVAADAVPEAGRDDAVPAGPARPAGVER
ncbi:cytochrome ubiquinol oxidase subunit I, partial [Frankia sp. CiP1_Cm_nod2]|uniref:cytochrome ubiquinol oxidase subunit I n=2 Tax=unclassified Frankia TaxID=2632575 RepID=UPI0020253305